jgi:hypothetical protein
LTLNRGIEIRRKLQKYYIQSSKKKKKIEFPAKKYGDSKVLKCETDSTHHDKSEVMK